MKTLKSPSKPNILKTSVIVLKVQMVLRVVIHACNPTWGLRQGLATYGDSISQIKANKQRTGDTLDSCIL